MTAIQKQAAATAAPQTDINSIAPPMPICTFTNCATQRKFISKRLHESPRTTIDFREMGIFACAVRIKELRESGYEIVTTLDPVIDPLGVKHPRVATYTLIKSPEKQEVV